MAKQRAILGGKLLNHTDYFAAVELQEDLTLTIKSVEREKLMRQDLRTPEEKPVFSFYESNRKFVCGNRENEDIMCRLYGNKAEDWVGKKITLYATTTRMGSDPKVPCIRIRNKIPGDLGPPIGKQAAATIESRLGEQGKSLDDLRKAVGAEGKLETWPKGLAGKIKAFLEGE